jgi:hypothetical protein
VIDRYSAITVLQYPHSAAELVLAYAGGIHRSGLVQAELSI